MYATIQKRGNGRVLVITRSSPIVSTDGRSSRPGALNGGTYELD